MVRCASGVTMTRQRPVGAPLVASGVSKWTPMLRRSCAKTLPNVSSATRPMYAAPPPNAATPAAVFGAGPPHARAPGGGVRRRPAGGLGGRAHFRIDLVGTGRVDHRHRAAFDAGAGDEIV